MNNLMVTTGAAFDVRGLDGLKREARNPSGEGLKAVAKQMEGIFIQMMLKSMRDASFKDSLFNSEQSDMFTSMYDQQISQNIASQSKLGFSELIIKQMGEGLSLPNAVSSTKPTSYKLNQISVPVTREKIAHSAGKPEIGLNQQSVLPAKKTIAKKMDFVSKLLEPAVAAAEKSGIPHLLIIAQAALESGWGNREITTAEGKKSHNLFGVKITPDWKGDSTEITTTEYINGSLQKVKAAFKVYPSYSSALEDYISLLTNNPRYNNVTRFRSPENAAHALQASGYATDPAYAQKLINVINKIKFNVNRGLDAYKTDLSSLF